MDSGRIEAPIKHSWPRLGAATRPRVMARLSSRLRFDRASGLTLVGLSALFTIGWFSSASHHASKPADELLAVLPSTGEEPATREAGETVNRAAAPEQTATAAPEASADVEPVTWAPDRFHLERHPSDHLPIDHAVPTRIRVVTIRARVTAYTPYDHRHTRPKWADGVVAWHPHGRRRHVSAHRYCLATDWAQFPPGATFISVPGYMTKSYGSFPERFRVVDDGCGAARKARKRGQQPVVDVRFMTRHSAIGTKDAWGTRHLDVEVVFPKGFEIPSSLKRWVVGDEWRVYHRGKRIE